MRIQQGENSGVKIMDETKKTLSRGVFWIIDGKLFAFPYSEAYSYGRAKSGVTYNHKKLWSEINPKSSKVPYNYYPRGRVEITSRGKVIIYTSPHVDKDDIDAIKVEFGIRDNPKICYDYSDHYKCYLDDGFVPAR